MMLEPSEKKKTVYISLFLIFFSSGVILCLIAASVISHWFSSQQPADVELPEESSALTDESEPNEFPADQRIDPHAVSIAQARRVLEILNSTPLTERDPVENAKRLGGLGNSSVMRRSIPANWLPGDSRNFWVLNINDNSYRQTTAWLVSQSPHLNFWVEEGVQYEKSQVDRLVETFENQIYPTNREFFGSEWSPGVDGDERLAILYAKGLGGAAGYHSSKDALSSQIDPFSNETEMFYLSADYMRLNDEDTYGVLAHEFQHMIHWNVDRNESAWVNEGLSELAVELNGFPVSGFDWLFSIDPDIQLTFWPGADQGDSRPHYGASYLFMKYFMDRFGISAIKALAAHPENGLNSIDAVLAELPSASGNAEQVFQDWTIANILQDDSTGEGYYAYDPQANIPQFAPTERIECGSGWQERSVHQFGTDYLQIDCEQPFLIEIRGEEVVPLLPVDPHSGDHFFWSNYGDESSMTLRRSFDLANMDEPIEMEYWTWFDIERDYDYAYLLASIDGENWEILEPSACTTENPTGANYGCGYNGRSQAWIRQSVDLSRFAGQEIILMFEYLTDGAVNGDGLLLDEISIRSLGYFTDFEEDNGGWEADGFVRVSNGLPQAYALAVINQDELSEIEKKISTWGLDYSRQSGGKNNSEETLVMISGITRHTRIPPEYQIRVEMIP